MLKKKPTTLAESGDKPIVVSASDKVRLQKLSKNRKLSIVYLLMFLILAVPGSWYGYNYYYHKPVTQTEHTNELKNIQNLVINDKYSETQTTLQTYLKKNLSQSQRFDALFSLGVSYDSQRNFSEALKYCLQAEMLDTKNSSLEATIANDYRQLNDKGNAIIHYQKAIDIAKNDAYAANDAYIAGYQYAIQILQSASANSSGQKQ